MSHVRSSNNELVVRHVGLSWFFEFSTFLCRRDAEVEDICHFAFSLERYISVSVIMSILDDNFPALFLRTTRMFLKEYIYI